MIGVVVQPSLKQKLMAWQARERRKSLSELCALLLEYAEKQLSRAGSLTLLFEEANSLGECSTGVSPRTKKGA
jgi:hypothetical protein